MQQMADQLKNKGGTIGKDINFIVGGRRICDYCLSHIPLMAKEMVLNSVTVYEQTTGRFYFLDMRNKKLGLKLVHDSKSL